MKFTNKQATTALSIALLLSVPAAQAGWMNYVPSMPSKDAASAALATAGSAIASTARSAGSAVSSKVASTGSYVASTKAGQLAGYAFSNLPTKEVAKEAVTRFVSENKKPLIIGGAVAGTGLAGFVAYKKLTAPKAVESGKEITLDLRNGQFVNVLEADEQLHNVTKVMLNGCGLTELNQDILDLLAQLPNLTELWLGQNQLTEVPANFMEVCPKLTVIGLANNQFTEVPAAITKKIDQFTLVNLDSNKIAEATRSGLNKVVRANNQK